MGNNLAPTLAIIYMNNLDQNIGSRFNSELEHKRYIDDIFISWSADNKTLDAILNTANSLNPAIRSTLDSPEEDRLPFLDTMITLHHNTGSFHRHYTLNQSIVNVSPPWDSHVPISKILLLLFEYGFRLA